MLQAESTFLQFLAPTPTILEAQANFAFNLLREVSTEPKSTILSPISVAIVLSMLYAGAKDKTHEEIGQLLAKGTTDSKIHEYFGELAMAFQQNNEAQKNYTLELANKLYVKSGFSLKQDFKMAINRYYGSQFESVNFAQSEATSKKINEFVEHETHNKIHDLIKPDDLDESTSLILLNAIYFKGNWAQKFNPRFTAKNTFYMSESNHTELDMMLNTNGNFSYFQNEQLQLLGMPYSGDEVQMFVLLPIERFGLDKLLAELSGKALLELIGKCNKVEVEVILPKFKLESEYNLKDSLEKLGLSTAFTSAANFGGISSEDHSSLELSQVIQKAIIELNEEGAEAAAATAAKAQMKSMPERFDANQPFAIFLMYKECTVLFNGIFRN